MKQHITMEQLLEFLEVEIKNGRIVDLNDEKHDRLRKILGLSEKSFPTLKHLNIGKMIEILDRQGDIIIEKGWGEWHIIYLKYECYNESLCDALWEVIKKNIDKFEV